MKLPVQCHERRGEIGAHHVERAVRQVDEVHDAEHQRQPRRQQKQQQPELQRRSRIVRRRAAWVFWVKIAEDALSEAKPVGKVNQHDGFAGVLNPSYGSVDRKTAAARSAMTAVFGTTPRSLHRAFVVEAVLVVLDDGGDGLQRQRAVGVLDHVLQIEVLDRDVIVAVFERAAQRFEFAFSIAAFMASFLLVSPPTATTALLINCAAS
jgi:hypothetical protein